MTTLKKSARLSTFTNRGKPSNTTSSSKSRFGYMHNRMFSNSYKRETDHVRESEFRLIQNQLEHNSAKQENSSC